MRLRLIGVRRRMHSDPITVPAAVPATPSSGRFSPSKPASPYCGSSWPETARPSGVGKSSRIDRRHLAGQGWRVPAADVVKGLPTAGCGRVWCPRRPTRPRSVRGSSGDAARPRTTPSRRCFRHDHRKLHSTWRKNVLKGTFSWQVPRSALADRPRVFPLREVHDPRRRRFSGDYPGSGVDSMGLLVAGSDLESRRGTRCSSNRSST